MSRVSRPMALPACRAVVAIGCFALAVILIPVRSTYAQSDMPPAAPTAVAVYSTTSTKLEVRWSSSDFANTTGFKVQWKSGNQDYGTSRQVSVDPATSLEPLSSTTSSRRYKHELSVLTDGTEYTVRVIASNAHGDSESSPEASGTPSTTAGQAVEFFENEIVDIHENNFPWLRETSTYITDRNIRVRFRSGGGGEVYFSCGIIHWLWQCRSSSIRVGRSNLGIIQTITHELAHVITRDGWVAARPGPLAIGHVYLSNLRVQDSDCSVKELFADIVMILVHGQRVQESSYYWSRCVGDNDTLTQEALAVVGSAVAGQMPDWFTATYADANSVLDLERLWADVIALPESDQRVAVYQLRDEFGGYCDLRSTADSAYRDGVTRNPWVDGGCTPQAPSDVDIAAISNGRFVVIWTAPSNDGGSPVEGYKVQWKSGSQEYDSSRQAATTDLANLSLTTPGLTVGVDYTVRVVAYNVNGDGAGSADQDVTASDANTKPVFPSTETGQRRVAENTGAGVNIGLPVAASDVDNDPLTYAISGADAAAFEIVATTGQLRTRAALDFETKSSYSATVSVHDGRNDQDEADTTIDDTISVTITVTDVNEAPAFPSTETGQRQVAENTPAGVNIGSPVAAASGDNDPLTYAISGTDAAAFEIVAATGQLRTRDPLDFETKSSYSATVSVHDGRNDQDEVDTTIDDTINVTITITDVNEVPVFPSSEIGQRRVAENTGAGVNIGLPVAASDVDNDSLTYAISGADAAAFEIVATTGQLRTRAALDFETKDRYTFTLSVHDGRNDQGAPDTTIDDMIGVTITVTDVNEVPVFPSSETGQRSVAENTGAGVNIGSPVAAASGDNDPLTYAISGTDAAAFEIVAATGQLRTRGALDFETKRPGLRRLTHDRRDDHRH